MSFASSDNPPERIFQLAQTAKGSALASREEFLNALDYFRKMRVYPHTVEAYEMDGELERINLECSILGLDKNSEYYPDAANENNFDLATLKIEASKECKYPVKFKIWVDAIDD